MLVTAQGQAVVTSTSGSIGPGGRFDARLVASFHQLLRNSNGTAQVHIGSMWHQSIEVVVGDGALPCYLCLTQSCAPSSSSLCLLHHVKQVLVAQPFLSSPLLFALEALAKQSKAQCDGSTFNSTVGDVAPAPERVNIGCDEMDEGLDAAEIQHILQVRHALELLESLLLQPLVRSRDAYYDAALVGPLAEATARMHSLARSPGRGLRGEAYLLDVQAAAGWAEVLHRSAPRDWAWSQSDDPLWPELLGAALESSSRGAEGKAPLMFHLHAPLHGRNHTLAISTYPYPCPTSSAEAAGSFLALVFVVPSELCHLPPPLDEPETVELGVPAALPHWLLQSWAQVHAWLASSFTPAPRLAAELKPLYEGIAELIPSPAEPPPSVEVDDPPPPDTGILYEEGSLHTGAAKTNQFWMPNLLPNMRSPPSPKAAPRASPPKLSSPSAKAPTKISSPSSPSSPSPATTASVKPKPPVSVKPNGATGLRPGAGARTLRESTKTVSFNDK